MKTKEEFDADCDKIAATIDIGKMAVEEVRRLKAVNAELLAALRPIAEHGEISAKIIHAARRAIAKAWSAA